MSEHIIRWSFESWGEDVELQIAVTHTPGEQRTHWEPGWYADNEIISVQRLGTDGRGVDITDQLSEGECAVLQSYVDTMIVDILDSQETDHRVSDLYIKEAENV